jgi:hypothetical protein
MELSPSWEAANCPATQQFPQHFMESEGSLQCSQESSTGPSRSEVFLSSFIISLFFYDEELLAPRPTLKLEDRPLSAVRDCLFNVFAATLHIWRPSSEDAPCGGDEGPVNMVVFSIKNLCSLLFHPCYMPGPAHLPLCEHNILWITKLWSTSLCNFLHFIDASSLLSSPNILLSALFRNTLRFVCFHLWRSANPHKTLSCFLVKGSEQVYSALTYSHVSLLSPDVASL